MDRSQRSWHAPIGISQASPQRRQGGHQVFHWAKVAQVRHHFLILPPPAEHKMVVDGRLAAGCQEQFSCAGADVRIIQLASQQVIQRALLTGTSPVVRPFLAAQQHWRPASRQQNFQCVVIEPPHGRVDGWQRDWHAMAHQQLHHALCISDTGSQQQGLCRVRDELLQQAAV